MKSKKQQKLAQIDPRTYVTSAFELDEEVKNTIKLHFGDSQEYVFTIDPSIIGGIIIKKQGELFDGSITNLLSKMRNSIISA